MQGNLEILHSSRMGDQMTMAQLLSQLSQAPPMAILKLCNLEMGRDLGDKIIQLSDDLDFTQEVLSAVGNHSELNPTMQAVLASFNRRRNFGRFKSGAQTLALER